MPDESNIQKQETEHVVSTANEPAPTPVKQKKKLGKKRIFKIAVAVTLVLAILFIVYWNIRDDGTIKEYHMAQIEELMPAGKVKTPLDYQASYTFSVENPDGQKYPIEMSVNHCHAVFDDGHLINSKSYLVMIGIDIKNQMRVPLIYDIEPAVYYPVSNTDVTITGKCPKMGTVVMTNDTVVDGGIIKPGQSAIVWVTTMIPQTVDKVRIEPMRGIEVTITLN